MRDQTIGLAPLGLAAGAFGVVAKLGANDAHIAASEGTGAVEAVSLLEAFLRFFPAGKTEDLTARLHPHLLAQEWIESETWTAVALFHSIAYRFPILPFTRHLAQYKLHAITPYSITDTE